MHTTTLSLDTLHAHGTLYADLMRVRSRVADDGAGEIELQTFDQYDTPASRWVTVHRDGRILAGVRLTPTTHRSGVYSYMLRDAQEGLIDALPHTLMHDRAPVDHRVWEASRSFVRDGVTGRDRQAIVCDLLGELVRVMRADGVTDVIGLLPVATPARIRRSGLVCRDVGPTHRIGGVAVVCAALSIPSALH